MFCVGWWSRNTCSISILRKMASTSNRLLMIRQLKPFTWHRTFLFFFFRLVIHGWRIWTKDALPSNSGFAWHGLSKWTWEQVLGKTHLFVVIFSIYSWFLSFEILSVMGRWCTPNLRDNYSYEIPAIEYLPKQIGEWLFHPRNEIETHHPCGFCCI